MWLFVNFDVVVFAIKSDISSWFAHWLQINVLLFLYQSCSLLKHYGVNYIYEVGCKGELYTYVAITSHQQKFK